MVSASDLHSILKDFNGEMFPATPSLESLLANPMKYRIDEHHAPILHSFGLKAHALMTTTNAMLDSSERRHFPAELSAPCNM